MASQKQNLADERGLQGFPAWTAGHFARYPIVSAGSSDRHHHQKQARGNSCQFANIQRRPHCDVRVYKNLHGTDIATAQGVTIRPSNIRSLIETLELAEVAAREEGLIV